MKITKENIVNLLYTIDDSSFSTFNKSEKELIFAYGMIKGQIKTLLKVCECEQIDEELEEEQEKNSGGGSGYTPRTEEYSKYKK